MATAKKGASTGAVAVKESTALATSDWKERLAKYAKQATDVASEASGGGNMISFRAGQMSYNKEPIAGNMLNVIVLESVLEHAYYGADFDPDNPTSPKCFALGRSEKEMAPHENSAEPQSEKCHSCEWNEFGTADKGKGKACKNIVRLALLPADKLTAAAIEKADAAYAKVPVTSVKEYAAYAKRLGAQGLPPFAVVTELKCAPDAKTQVKVSFEQKQPIPNEETMEAIIRHHEQQVEAIMYTYPKPTAEEAPAKKPAAKKPATKRKY